VVIPAGTPNSPYLSGNDTVAYVTVQSGATLTLGSVSLTVINDLNLYGNLVMNMDLAYLNVQGDLYFRAGSDLNMSVTTSIWLWGNVEFHTTGEIFGALELRGTSVQYIRTYVLSYIYSLIIDKPSGTAYISSTSTAELHVTNLTVKTGSTLYHNYTGETYVVNRFEVETGATCNFYHGGLVIQGNVSPGYIIFNGSGFLNDLRVANTSHAMTMQTDLYLKGEMRIEGAGLIAGTNTITLEGDWVNSGGPSIFWEAGSRVIFTGAEYQYIQYPETFDILELNKSGNTLRIENAYPGYVDHQVTCAQYDWTAGGIHVIDGTFTANMLLDNGIAGSWHLNTGSTINLHNYGTGRYVDILGDFHIYGGNFNVYGGDDDSWWASASNTYFGMIGGTLDFKDTGMSNRSTSTLTENITAGTIRVNGKFEVLNAGFTPQGGFVEMYGSTDVILYHVAGANLYNLVINKQSVREGEPEESIIYTSRDGNTREVTRTNSVTATSNLNINSSFTLSAGYFTAPAVMNVRHSWYNNAGTEAFIEGTGKVIFDGISSYIYDDENFHELEMNLLDQYYLIIHWSVVTCNSFDWTSGALKVMESTFTAYDLADPGIFGTVELTSGTINYHQDPGQRMDLRGNLIISDGIFNVHGGSGNCALSFNPDVATLTMSGGILDFKDWGVYTSATMAFNNNISGGTIRTVGNFINARTDFNPIGGTIVLYGSGGKFNIGESMIVANAGTVMISNGILNLNHNTLTTTGNVDVYGTLKLDSGSILKLSHGKSLSVYNGGYLESIGTAAQPVTFTNYAAGNYYSFNVESGGTIAAAQTIFEYMNRNGVNIKNGAAVHATYRLNDCTFRNGMSNGTLLIVNNNQDLTINGAVFPANTWSGSYNVAKGEDQGSVCFLGWSGAFGGSANENDPFNLITWKGEAISPITDLSISYQASSNLIRLNWSYPQTVTEFRIYSSATPDGTFSLVGTTPNTYWSQALPGDIYFYRVTAVLP
jgi:hypothetical protein